MAPIRTGNATPEKRERRTILTVADARFESLVAGLGIEGELLHELRRFAKATATAAGRFQVARRKAGLFGSRTLSKIEADEAYRVAFSPKCGEVAR